MLELNLKKYKELNIFYYEKNFLEVAKKVIDKDFTTFKILKDSKRNYVSLIEVDGKKYIYKEPRNEFRIPQRQFTTLLKNNLLLSVYKI